MRFAAILALATAAAALQTRSPSPQSLGEFLDNILGAIPVVGPAFSSIGNEYGTLGDLINIPGDSLNGASASLTPNDWQQVRLAFGKLETTLQPKIEAAKQSQAAAVEKRQYRDNNGYGGDRNYGNGDPLSDAISTIPVIGGPLAGFSSAGVNALGGIFNVGGDLINDVLGNLGFKEKEVVEGAVEDIRRVFVGHLEGVEA